jgi:site-specific DNA recombinase
MDNKAIIYARVSTREQEETGYSLDAQKALLQEYCTKNNLAVVKIFSASESASGKKERETFQEMLSYANKENINNIICEKTDRLTRNPKDAGVINDWIILNKLNTVHFVKESFIADNHTRAHEGFMWNMKVSMAKYYTDNLSEEVKKGNLAKAKQGWLPRQAKIGYITTGENGHKIHVPDPKKSEYIKTMFSYYATGNYSLEKLADEMYVQGFRSKTGRRIPKSNINNYLSDTFYYGYFQWEGKTYKGNHDTLVSKALFDKVQEIKNRKLAPKYSKHTHLFVGKFKCNKCNGVVTWEKQKGHTYGHCNKYRKCEAKPWYKESVIDKKISSLFGNLVIKNEYFANWLKKALKENNQSESDYRENNINVLKDNLNRIERRLDNLYNDRLDERISVEVYDTKSKDLIIEKESIIESIKSYSITTNKSKELGITIFELSQKAPTLYAKATLEEKRKLISLVFSSLILNNGEIEFEYTDPFKILATAVEETNSSKVVKSIKSPIQIFEPTKEGSTKSSISNFDATCSKVLPDRDSNPD